MVSEEEQALIRERMAEAGIRNMGAYMRKMALNGYVLHVDLSPVRELVSLQRPTPTAASTRRRSPLCKGTMRPYGGRCLIYWKGSPPWWSFDPPGSGVLPLPGFHDFGTLCPKVAKAAYREEGYSRPQPTSGLTR